MARLFALVLLAHTVLAVVSLIGCLSADGEDIRALPRVAWVPIVLLFVLAGPIAWFLVGRPAPEGIGGRPLRAVWPRATRPVAPDDDPEFLRSLDTSQSRKDRDLFEQWEDDLRRAEDHRRRAEEKDPRRAEGDVRPEQGGRAHRRDDELHPDQRDDLRYRQNEEGQPEA